MTLVDKKQLLANQIKILIAQFEQENEDLYVDKIEVIRVDTVGIERSLIHGISLEIKII